MPTGCASERMKSVLRDFYNATGINIQFFDTDLRVYGYEITHNPYCSAVKKAKPGMCRMSDMALVEKCRQTKAPTMHVCHAGLMDIAVPVLYNEAILGYVILGQMRRDRDFAAVSGYLENLGICDGSMREHYASLFLYDDEKIQSILNLAEMVTKYILLEHMLVPELNGVMQRAFAYIDQNLHLPISVEDIANGALAAKSTLYKYFRDFSGGTVGDYLMHKRIERAQKLLVETDLPIQEIAQAVGFSSAAYFTANFKKEKGVPPLRFRKLNA